MRREFNQGDEPMRTLTLKISASLAFAMIASAGLRRRAARKVDAAGRRHGRLGLRNPARVQRGRRAEIFEGHADRAWRRRGAPGIGRDGSRQPGRADRADRETPVPRRLQGALAGGIRGHPPHPGNFRVHRQAVHPLHRAPNAGANRAQEAEQRERTDNEAFFNFSPLRSRSPSAPRPRSRRSSRAATS